MVVVNWNVHWASASWRTDEIRRRIHAHAPEVVCLTETHCGRLEGGHSITSQGDHGYGREVRRRKVLLWSRQPWREVNDVGDDRMPPGRFVSGATESSLGDVTVAGVCVPWQSSRAGKKDGGTRRAPWEDHEQYLERLEAVLARAPGKRLVMMGDFNQTIAEPGSGTSGAVAHRAALLRRAMPRGMSMKTAEPGQETRKRPIDHIAVSADLRIADVEPISNMFEGRWLADHACGVSAVVTVRTDEGRVSPQHQQAA